MIAGVIVVTLCATQCRAQARESAQMRSLTGRWVVMGKAVHSGEQDRALFDLKQDGNKLSGTVRTLGYVDPIRGAISGNHFELFRADPGYTDPYVIGDLIDKELHGRWQGVLFTARPATPTDDFPSQTYIEPPTLHDVPSNGLAKTPPMGWNSWNFFADKVDDHTIRAIADVMVTSGMRDAGYIYVNIDGDWQGYRDAQGNIHPNKKFPDMKALADYIHSKGLKLGIYSSPGPYDCAGYLGGYGHEQQDAATFASWNVDYLKYDWCSAASIYSDDKLQPVYQKMGDALRATGRPIVYSLCEYGRGTVETWGGKVGGNLWRTTYDIRDEWSSMIFNIEKQAPTAPYAEPGHWNDPDMLEVGNEHMTDDEYRTHMSLWALSAAPLLAGNDLRNMTEQTKAILMNREVIAIDQDPLGKQASPVKNGQLETWVKPLADGSVAVGVVNLGNSAAMATVKADDLLPDKQIETARDLWAHKDVKFADGAYSREVPSHGILLLRVSGN